MYIALHTLNLKLYNGQTLWSLQDHVQYLEVV